MNDFNFLNNFNNRFQNLFLNRKISNEKANLVQFNQTNQANQTSQLNQTNQINLFNSQNALTTQGQNQSNIQNQEKNLNNIIFNYETSQMSQEETLEYLQKLLDLPDDVEKTLKELSKDSKNLKTFINNLLSIKVLGQILNQKTTSALEKLIQTISIAYKTTPQKAQQLEHVFKILNSIQSNLSQENNILKEFLLLYIPLSMPIFNKQTSPLKLSENENTAIDNSILSILFETINFSNILFCINEIDNALSIEIFSNDKFPSEKFVFVLKNLSKDNVSNLSFQFNKLRKEDKKYEEQNFRVIAKNIVSSNVLILSALIIKSVFKLDENIKTI